MNPTPTRVRHRRRPVGDPASRCGAVVRSSGTRRPHPHLDHPLHARCVRCGRGRGDGSTSGRRRRRVRVHAVRRRHRRGRSSSLARLTIAAVAPTDATVGDELELRITINGRRGAGRRARARPARYLVANGRARRGPAPAHRGPAGGVPIGARPAPDFGSARRLRPDPYGAGRASPRRSSSRPARVSRPRCCSRCPTSSSRWVHRS